MPTVNVNRKQLFQRLGQSYTDEEFDHLCFQFGIELDEVVPSETDPNDPTYKIDIPANRYDLLCIEGISRALLIFLRKIKAPLYKSVLPDSPIQTVVKKEVGSIRPFLVTAVLRGVNIDAPTYASLIDLQEKLHHNICRKRAFVAIGVHDLSTLSPPFVYTAEKPEAIKFIPLNKTKAYNGAELMELYSSDSHLKQYLGIIRDFEKYPVIRDQKGTVLSLPPIINGDHSKINVGKVMDLFFECTATDLKKARIVLDTLITMLSEYTQFTAETTEVIYEDGQKKFYYPELGYREQLIKLDKAREVVGVDLSSEEISLNLCKMSLECEKVDGGGLKVMIPPTRQDVLHACDIYEDIAISYGYDNIHAQLPPMMTISRQFPLNKLTDLLRENMAMAGFTEALTFSLCSIDDECERLRISRDSHLKNLALIANPKTIEFQTARYSLLPGVLKTIQANKKMPLPLQLFEISDVVRLSSSADTGCVNRRNLCAVYNDTTPGFEIIHGLLDRVMELLEVKDYRIKADDGNPTFFEGRCAQVIHQDEVIGHIGVLHPDVLTSFELPNPASCLEICIEGFL